MSINIILNGEVPSKKNNKRLVVAGGRPLLMPSTNYQRWHKDVLWQLKKVKPYAGEYPVRVTIEVYPGAKRRKDLDNISSSILDTIVDAGIIVDDDITHVYKLEVMFVEYDKENPRALIWIG